MINKKKIIYSVVALAAVTALASTAIASSRGADDEITETTVENISTSAGDSIPAGPTLDIE
ncbi:MAG: hypothetical protein K2K93_09865, partial [Muribaculaceae bacterium]|nr:hypothetical protein [Muribaculaceae bacterium]